MLGGSVHAIKRNIEALLVGSKEIALEVNANQTKYMVMSQDQNEGRIHNAKIHNSSFKKVEGFKYLETILQNPNSIQDGTKSRLKSGNACYYSVQNPLSSSFLSKNVNTKIYSTLLPVVLYGCESWSLTMREERRLRVF
jgi:hypothetical protein